MSDNSAIEWTDATWNPLLGCTKVSEGCRGCYAILQAWVKQHNPNPKIAAAYAGLVEKRPDGSLNWTGRVNLIPERLEIPLHWRDPRRVFVNSMSDLFHPNVPDEFIDRVFGVMAIAKRHAFQVLTKRPERMREYLTAKTGEFGYGARSRIWDAARHFSEAVLHQYHYDVLPVGRPGQGPEGVYIRDWPLPNVWLGTSVENQQAADVRVPHLLATPAAVRFISAEPLLGPVDLTKVRMGKQPGQLGDFDQFVDAIGGWHVDGLGFGRRIQNRIDWVITGGESGPRYREIDPAWARSLRDQCVEAGVSFFFKQWSGRTSKANGRLLDGRTWDEMPKPRVAVPA